MSQPKIYKPGNHIRIVTATSLFDGHDAAINIMRRMIQAAGVEVIHLGHNRSVTDIVDTAIQEDVQAIAITSYQGGHIEFFKYMFDLLRDRGAGHIKIFGGGGGVILPDEIKELMSYGITRIYSPDDGRKMGLQGMINDLVKKSDFIPKKFNNESKKMLSERNHQAIGQLLTAAENHPAEIRHLQNEMEKYCGRSNTPVIGITGTGGAGKSSLIDELVRRFINDFPKKTLGIISVDPSRRRSGGALLGDRIRMNAISSPMVFMRSLATRQANLALSKHIREVLCIYKAIGFDLIILETSGIGQSDTEIVDYSDISLYVMTPEYGAATQLEKIDMLDFTDMVAINKFDKRGAADALRDVKKQYQRNRQLFDVSPEEMPVFGTIASQFNDPGMHRLYQHLIGLVDEKNKGLFRLKADRQIQNQEKMDVISPSRERYLSEISAVINRYNADAKEQSAIANKLYGLKTTIDTLMSYQGEASTVKSLEDLLKNEKRRLLPENEKIIKEWPKKIKSYKKDDYSYLVRGKEIRVDTHTRTLSGLKMPKIALPKYEAWGDVLLWNLKENVPGEFPYAAGVFPFRREAEDPARMFAGEGGPERTNKRFHYLSRGLRFKRLSTAFDSVTLYGGDPDRRPDIFGKVGNSGVSIASLDDAKKLYSGFNLADPHCSVSMTINGPAPILVGYFMNAAIDQQCEVYIRNNGLEKAVQKKIQKIFKENGSVPPEYRGKLPAGNDGLGLMLLGVTGDQVLEPEVYEKIKAETIARVRGTVQADILKEDQAQNTCIFSTEFALKLMGDVQEYFINNHVRNFYSVSISGYHIAEAGANPITQLAFTLANGFTYVEYYLSRGMPVDDFAPNLSFFFSNGVDPEYSVIGRVARIIWAKAMKYKYGANERSQKLKYHIQTSGRSLHAQEIEFNDIRTSLQALTAIYDNCNSLHTNAYDEAITTPTEESVRRAMAIQLIINHEFGLTKNQNPQQGSFIIEELTSLVEEAVLNEFDQINERGGVLGAMETMYQRGKIQAESLHYESLKHSGELPLVGVNMFLSSEGSPTIIPDEVIRATESEKRFQIQSVKQFQKHNETAAARAINDLKETTYRNGNIFESIMTASKYCTLGQLTDALYEVGGQYRRNM